MRLTNKKDKTYWIYLRVIFSNLHFWRPLINFSYNYQHEFSVESQWTWIFASQGVMFLCYCSNTSQKNHCRLLSKTCFREFLLVFCVKINRGSVPILAVFQGRPMFHHINETLSPEPFEFGWTHVHLEKWSDYVSPHFFCKAWKSAASNLIRG